MKIKLTQKKFLGQLFWAGKVNYSRNRYIPLQLPWLWFVRACKHWCLLMRKQWTIESKLPKIKHFWQLGDREQHQRPAWQPIKKITFQFFKEFCPVMLIQLFACIFARESLSLSNNTAKLISELGRRRQRDSCVEYQISKKCAKWRRVGDYYALNPSAPFGEFAKKTFLGLGVFRIELLNG